jgi:phospholipase/carboxylesterase
MQSSPIDYTILYQGMIFHLRKPVSNSHGNVNLLLHGWTGDENSMNSFWCHFPNEDWLIAPRAPQAASPTGFAWAQIAENKYPSYDQYLPSTKQLLSNLNSLREEYHLAESKMNIVGFSQGGAMAYLLSAIIPDEIKSIFSIAGFLPQGTIERLQKLERRSHQFFILHGARDKLVPVEIAIQDEASLRSIGYQTHLCIDENSGHKLGATCTEILKSSL